MSLESWNEEKEDITEKVIKKILAENFPIGRGHNPTKAEQTIR